MKISQDSYTQRYQPPVKDIRDKQIQALERQKQTILERREQVKESKLDSKIKNEKIKELQEQITQINTQIQQIKIEKMKKKIEPEESEKKESEEEKLKKKEMEEKGVVYTPSMKGIIKASNTYSQCANLGKLRAQMKGEIAVAQSEATHSTSPSKYQMDRLPELKESLSKIEGTMVEKFREIDKEIRKEQKGNSKETEVKREGKNANREELEKENGINNMKEANKKNSINENKK